MVYRAKLRVSLKSGKSQKLSFEVGEGKVTRLFGGAPGLEILSELTGDPKATVCSLEIRDGQVAILSSSSRPLIVNGIECGDFKLRNGDLVSFDEGTIEVVELNSMESVEEERTRYVTAPAIEVPQAPKPTDGATSVVMNSRTPDSATSMTTRTPSSRNDSATAMIMRSQSSDGATAMVMKNELPETRMIRRDREKSRDRDRGRSRERSRSRRSRSSEESSYEPSYRERKPFPWTPLLVSLAVMGGAAEAAATVGFGFKFPVSPFPSGAVGACVALAFVCLSGIFAFLDRPSNMAKTFVEYLKTFAAYSILLIPYALSYAFPLSVVIFASIVLGGAWIVLFSHRHFGGMNGFVPISAGAWMVVIVMGLHARNWMFIEMGGDAGHGREIASETAPAAPAVPVTVQPAVVVQAPAAPAQQQAAQPQAPAAPVQPQANNKQNLDPAALDPMAVEQFFNAVKSGNLRLVRKMVDNHVIDPIFTLQNGSSGLHFAAAQGDYDMVKYLLSKRVNIDAQDAGGTTPLMWATYHKHNKVVEYLISKRAKLDIRREGGDRAIDIAKRSRDKKIYAILEEATRQRALASLPSKKKKKKSTHHR